MLLFEEPAPALPDVAVPEPAPACLEDCVRQFVEDLLAPGKSGGPCLLVQAFRFAELRFEPADEKGDALTTHILGFPPEDLPRFTHNLCKTLGDIFEKLIFNVYGAAYPQHFSRDFEKMKTQVDKARKKLEAGKGRIGKWCPDFLIALIAYEIKYRCANGQGATEQSWGAVTLAALGYLPRMLLFRLSPNSARFQRNGWGCFEAEGAVAQIKKDTGVDILEVIRRAGEDPRIALRREMGLRDLFQREARGTAYRLETYGHRFAQIDPATMARARDACARLP